VKIVTADCHLDLGYCRIPAGQRTVVSDGAAIELRKALDAEGEPLRISGMGHYTRHYCGQDLGSLEAGTGRRLLVWRGCGIGDQLMVTGVLRALGVAFPDAPKPVLYSDPRLWRQMWADPAPGLPFHTRPEPIPFEDWRSFDYHLVLADMCEADSEPDQGHTVDRMLWAAGLDPDQVPARLKIPCVPVNDHDRRAARELLADVLAWDAARPSVLWQVASSTPIRSYRPARLRLAMERLHALLPDVPIVAVGRDCEFRQVAPLPSFVTPVSAPVRLLFALVEQAACVVAPDSCLAHAAGGLRRPCVGLWGSFSPSWRAAHYPDHVALQGRRECAPCGIHECGSSQRDDPGCPRCKRQTPDDPYCAALAQIDPDEVAAAVASVVARQRQETD